MAAWISVQLEAVDERNTTKRCLVSNNYPVSMRLSYVFIWPDLDIRFNKDYWCENVNLYKNLPFAHVDKSSNPKKSALNITDVKLKSIHNSQIMTFGSLGLFWPLFEFKETRTKVQTLYNGLLSPHVLGQCSQLFHPETALRSAECLIINFAQTIKLMCWMHKTHKLTFGPKQSISSNPHKILFCYSTI